MTPSQLLSTLHFRYATKQFDPSKKIPGDLWSVLEEALRLAPSSFGLQPWKFIVIDDPALRERLRAASWNQSQVTDASHLVVLASRTDLDEGDIDRWIACLAASQNRDAPMLEGYRKIISGFAAAMPAEARRAWNARQIYIALGQFMTAAAAAGVDTCPLEGIDAAAYDEILSLAGAGYATACACAAGYRSPDDKYAAMPKARFPLEEVIEHR